MSTELKDTIEAIGKAFEEFKAENDKKLKELSTSKDDPILTEKIDKINAEIEAVNASQCHSELIRFNKSLDPDRLEQEYTCGSVSDTSRLNNDLAFVPLDPTTFDVPRLPTPPPLDDVAEALNALADAVRQDNPQAADAAYG